MFTAAQKKTAVERELSFRRRVYPRWIEQKKMTQMLADNQIAIFEAIRNDYSAAEEIERLI
jgi:anti-sigma regulatory factor (Ser/Thr protein kinase)